MEGSNRDTREIHLLDSRQVSLPAVHAAVPGTYVLQLVLVFCNTPGNLVPFLRRLQPGLHRGVSLQTLAGWDIFPRTHDWHVFGHSFGSYLA